MGVPLYIQIVRKCFSVQNILKCGNCVKWSIRIVTSVLFIGVALNGSPHLAVS